jgi:hypothetical protein
MTIALILNIVFSAGVLTVLLGAFVWSIATQHRDRGLTLVSGPRRHRWTWSQSGRPQVAPTYRLKGQPWPAR